MPIMVMIVIMVVTVMVMVIIPARTCMRMLRPKVISRRFQHQPSSRVLHKMNQFCLEPNITSVAIRLEIGNTSNKNLSDPPRPFCPQSCPKMEKKGVPPLQFCPHLCNFVPFLLCCPIPVPPNIVFSQAPFSKKSTLKKIV